MTTFFDIYLYWQISQKSLYFYYFLFYFILRSITLGTFYNTGPMYVDRENVLFCTARKKAALNQSFYISLYLCKTVTWLMTRCLYVKLRVWYFKGHIFTEISFCQNNAVSPLLVSDLCVFLIDHWMNLIDECILNWNYLQKYY